MHEPLEHLAFQPGVKIITDEACTGYSAHGHPERPQRISRTVEKLRHQSELSVAWGEPAAVEETSLLRAHTPGHLERLNQPSDFDGDTPYLPKIANHARRSVGAALAAMNSARTGQIAFSLMRPPGHHAMRDRAMGFCYLNNIAIAALEALATGTNKVAVYDFDVHHGNGTENILLNQAGAAFFSIHQYPLYPGTGTRDVGKNCFNFPIAPDTPREQYRHVLERALTDMRKLKPELIGVSAGFDAYARDPLAQGTLEAQDYHWLGQSLRNLGVPLFAVLEGGYSEDLPELVFAFLKGLDAR